MDPSEREMLGLPPLDYFWWVKRRHTMDPLWEQRLREHYKFLDLQRKVNDGLVNLERRTTQGLHRRT